MTLVLFGYTHFLFIFYTLCLLCMKHNTPIPFYHFFISRCFHIPVLYLLLLLNLFLLVIGSLRHVDEKKVTRIY